MSYTSGFFDAVDLGGGDYDREYSAAVFAHYFSLLVKNGVFPDPSTGMQVKASTNPDMHVSVQPGSGWVNGYYITVSDDSPEVLTVPTANPSLSRIDSVIMGLNYVEREIQLYIKSGAVSASPSAVSLQRDNDLYEMELAQITVAAGVASISQANITDMRQNTSRCGIVKGTIDQIDTTDLFAQYNDAFQTWFADIQAQLSGDVATNLQNQINQLKDNKVNVSDKANVAQVQEGTDDTKWVTSLLVKSFYDYYKATKAEAEAGINSTKWLSPSTGKASVEKWAPLSQKILSDTTRSLLALTSSATPDLAFQKLALGVGKYGYKITVKTPKGHPVSGVTVTGVTTITGGTCVTDSSGTVLGVSTATSVSLSVTSPYVDLDSKSQSVTSSGVITDVSIVLPNKSITEASLTSSGTLKLSPDVSEVDFCLVGGGGSGTNYGAGGGGGYVTNLLNQTFDPIATYTATIAGPTGTTILSKNGAQIASAAGGTNAQGQSVGGTGNGNGGVLRAGSIGTNGTNGTGYKFNEASLGLAGGGGGGGGGSADGYSHGGSPYGGNGGGGTPGVSTAPTGPGGGGGAGGWDRGPGPSNGASGILYYRWRK